MDHIYKFDMGLVALWLGVPATSPGFMSAGFLS